VKTTLSLILMSVFQFSFYSYSQNELIIINISENQEGNRLFDCETTVRKPGTFQKSKLLY